LIHLVNIWRTGTASDSILIFASQHVMYRTSQEFPTLKNTVKVLHKLN